jgi:DNA-binding transcriptional ArsR family regulator
VTPTAATASLAYTPTHVLPLPRVLADIERRHDARRFADGRPEPAVVRVFYAMQLYAGPQGTGEVQSTELCRRLNLSRQAVSLALRRLIGLRLITVTRRLDGQWMVVRFLFREIYRLFKRGCSRVVNGVLSFCSSFPQDVSPIAHMVRTRGVTTRNSKDGAPRSSGALMGRLRAVACADYSRPDKAATVLLRTVGDLVFHHGRLPDFVARPAAIAELERVLAGRHASAPGPAAPLRRFFAWARDLVEQALDTRPERATVAETIERCPDDVAVWPALRELLSQPTDGAGRGLGVVSFAELERADDARAAQARSAAAARFAAWCAEHPGDV